LGLNIVYRILTKYRGQISVESNEGEGTTFHVRFPVEPDPITSGD
ncbi:MAG: HAMP domain-containing histidine kinase, partial [Myxococcales bacterium]|nr:HAMP domain-containing histidine kinase [Myxococcales bacterium]